MHHPFPAAGIFELGDALFAEAICAAHSHFDRPILVGFCGSQGSGKSTSAARLAARLDRAGRRTALCSIDDFYLTRAEREALGRDVHPLLATRGVPGTHDVELMRQTIAALLTSGEASVTALPSFDKAADDRLAPSNWRRHEGAADIVLLEGWCVGARAQRDAALLHPINTLERDEDMNGKWRRYVNDQLAGPYAGIFDALDLKLMLRAPSFAQVHGWRKEQEAGLNRDSPDARPPMDDEAISRFISHYERLTRWLLRDEPAHLIADLDAGRRPTGWRLGDVFGEA